MDGIALTGFHHLIDAGKGTGNTVSGSERFGARPVQITYRNHIDVRNRTQRFQVPVGDVTRPEEVQLSTFSSFDWTQCTSSE